MSGVLYFDGNCGMCTRSVNALTKRQRTGDLRIAPFQAAGTADRLGVPADQMLEAAWWQESSGRCIAALKPSTPPSRPGSVPGFH